MMLGLCPIFSTQVGLRTLSAGYSELPIWSCCRPERVSDLVRDDELQQPAHQRVGHRQRAAPAGRAAPPA